MANISPRKLKMRRVTVFGGSGFVGRHLVRRLAAAGVEVRVACRDLESALFLKPCGDVGQIVPWQVDINDPAQVATAVDGADAVVNLVGILYERGQRTFQRVHVDGARSIAQASAAAGARRLIHMSALGADQYAPSVYGQTKWQGEQAVLEAFPDATIFRPSVIFGPEDDFFNMFAGMTRFLPVLPVIGAPLLPGHDGGVRFQPVYVGDVAQAMTDALAMDGTRGQTYDLGGPKVYTFRQLMELVLAVTGRKRALLPLPLGLASFEALFLQWLPKPLLTPDQVLSMARDNVCAADGFAAFGIRPAAAEAILPTYLHRFRTPRQQGAAA